MPVHARSVGVVDLQAVHAQIPLFAVGRLRENERKCDESAAVVRPAFQHGDFGKVDVFARFYDLLTRRAASEFPGQNAGERERLFCQVPKVGKGFRRVCLRKLGDFSTRVGEPFDSESRRHAPVAAEKVDRYGEGLSAVVHHVFEKQSLAAVGLFRFGVGVFRDFNNRRNLVFYAHEFPRRVEHVDKFGYVFVGFFHSPHSLMNVCLKPIACTIRAAIVSAMSSAVFGFP